MRHMEKIVVQVVMQIGGRRDDQFVSVQGALAASRKAPKDEFQEDGTQKINPSSHRQQRQPEEGTGETPLPHSSQ
jgi:hypothetical protein